MPDGKIVSATRETHPDLFWALRGAGTTVGIVTKFEMLAFEQGEVWGGVKQYVDDAAEEQALAALARFCDDDATADFFAEAFIITAYVAPLAKFLSTAVLAHGKPQDDPAVFDSFKAIPAMMSSTKVRSIADLSVELNANNPHGLRYSTTQPDRFSN